ncbi:MAG: hypothetical protein M1819_003984 [Sarea resinae]|nr:MAG: hypothetical protein M1819_003984 [Sarea resinae]
MEFPSFDEAQAEIDFRSLLMDTDTPEQNSDYPPMLIDTDVPWHNNNWFLSQFNITELQMEAALELYGSSYGDLANPVLSFFERDNFMCFDADYQKLVPVLRLASRLLMDGCSLRFLHALVYNLNEKLSDELSADIGGIAYEYRRNEHPLTREEKLNIINVINGMKGYLTFFFTDSINPSTTWARTGYDYANAKFHPMGGLATIIEVQDRLRVACDDDDPCRTISMVLRSRLILAITLCHEVCHAIGMATYPVDQDDIDNPKPLVEPFFEDDRQAEVGFAFEQTLFGGCIDPIEADAGATWGLSIEKFPSLVTKKHAINDDPVVHHWPERRGPKAFSTRYLVRMEYVQSLFMTEFWSHGERANSMVSLKVWKHLGVRYLKAPLEDDDLDDTESIDSDDSSLDPGIERPISPEPGDGESFYGGIYQKSTPIDIYSEGKVVRPWNETNPGQEFPKLLSMKDCWF